MPDIHSTVTELPLSCKSAAENVARELAREEAYAELPEACLKKLTSLEENIQKETGERVALVAYRL